MEPGSEETQWKDKKQHTQIATGEILNICNRKFLPLESCSAVKHVHSNSGESSPLEMFKMCGDKALSNLIWLCSYPCEHGIGLETYRGPFPPFFFFFFRESLILICAAGTLQANAQCLHHARSQKGSMLVGPCGNASMSTAALASAQPWCTNISFPAGFVALLMPPHFCSKHR